MLWYSIMDNHSDAFEVQGREEKKKELFLNQKHTLDLFLERGAISREQYDKSLGDLTVKMGIKVEDCES